MINHRQAVQSKMWHIVLCITEPPIVVLLGFIRRVKGEHINDLWLALEVRVRWTFSSSGGMKKTSGPIASIKTSDMNLRGSLPSSLPLGMLNIQRLDLRKRFSMSSHRSSSDWVWLLSVLMVESTTVSHSKLSPITDSMEVRRLWNEVIVVCSESREACIGLMASWIKVETSSLSEVLCLANSADSWSIATTASAGFSVVMGAPAVVGGLLATKDASLSTACDAGVCKLTDFACLDMLNYEKLVKLTSAVKLLQPEVWVVAFLMMPLASQSYEPNPAIISNGPVVVFHWVVFSLLLQIQTPLVPRVFNASYNNILMCVCVWGGGGSH